MSQSHSWTPLSYPVQSVPPPPPPPSQSPVPLSPPVDSSVADIIDKEFGSSPPTSSVESPPPEESVPRVPREIRALRDGRNTDIRGRTLIVCLDGTGDKFDGDNSNIVHLVGCLKKSDPSQVTYYQSGIGTYDGGGLSNGVRAAVDMAVGSGLGVHIRDAYQFLMQTYREHDRICLFGFSRGAYTARCLAGMIHKVGLLPAHNRSQIDFGYQYYKDDSPYGWKMSAEFKRTFAINVSVHFIGVFDSVASVGFIPRRLPLSSTPRNKATYFRHAMALDEHRAKFKVCRFQRKDEIGPGAHWETIAELHEQPAGRPVRRFSSNLGISKERGVTNGGEKTEVRNERLVKREDLAPETDVLEVWFTGCHADVGGGAVKNEERHKLSQVPLRWMIRQCFACDTGIIFKAHSLAEEGIDVHTLYPVYTPLQKPTIAPAPSMLDKYETGDIAPIVRRSSVLKPVDERQPRGLHDVHIFSDLSRKQLHADWVPEQVEDYFDSISPINDQLVQAKGWWVLEVWPIKVRIQPPGSDEWIKKVSVNHGRFRPVQDHAPNLHWTVEQRMEVKGYETRVRLDRNARWNTVV